MLWMSFPTVAAHASGSGSEFSEDQILFHFERAVGLVPAELEAQIESHRLYLERGGDFLPVLGKQFSQKLGDFRYQSEILRAVRRPGFSGNRNVILHELRQLLPTLTGDSIEEDNVLLAGLALLGRYGVEGDLKIIGRFADHEYLVVRRAAESGLRLFEMQDELDRREAENAKYVHDDILTIRHRPVDALRDVVVWFGILVACLLGNISAALCLRLTCRLAV